MAGGNLLTLIDDIASVLDDVALLTKAATKKTAGVLGDDLALNAHQVSGVGADRELPVVWAVARGSLRNKAILVPAALALNALAPFAVAPLLMTGGAFLCYEGCEKLAQGFRGKQAADRPSRLNAATGEHLLSNRSDLELQKIGAAVRTDFILSAEIIVIALGTVAAAPFARQVAVLGGIAIIMTIGVYGLVAGIVKLDDFGLYLIRADSPSFPGRMRRALGSILVGAAPAMMKALSVAGTAAMFAVGGSILGHGVPSLGPWIETLPDFLAGLPVLGGLLRPAAPLLLDIAVGLLAGGLVLVAVRAARGLAKVAM